MINENYRPVLIVIAGPNGSGKTTITSRILHHEWMEIADRTYVYDNSINNKDAKLLFRMSEGEVIKQYTSEIPEWEETIYYQGNI